MKKERLQKIISAAGICSRRKAEELIMSQKVKVNGHIAKLGDGASEKDVVTVDGKTAKLPRTVKGKKEDRFIYLKFYKPRGILCTMSDPHAEEDKTLSAFFKDFAAKNVRVYPVGRLDKNSEGLVIMTNNGEFANNLAHPKNTVEKHYRVTIRGNVSDEKMDRLAAGVVIELDDKRVGKRNYTTTPCVVEKILSEKGSDDDGTPQKTRTVLGFILKEGKNRQIRKMCEKVGLEVSRLKRTSVGSVKLGMLKPGKYEHLTKEELKGLD